MGTPVRWESLRLLALKVHGVSLQTYNRHQNLRGINLNVESTNRGIDMDATKASPQ